MAAAKEAFPKWAALPAADRAKLIRKLGDLIAAHVPELATDRDPGHRTGHRADRQAAGPAGGGQFLLLRRDVRAGRRSYLSDLIAPQLHAFPSGRRVRAHLTLERAVHDLHLEGGSGARFRQHGGAQDERAVAAHRGPAGGACARSGNSQGRIQCRARIRHRGGRALVQASGRSGDLLHRIDRDRQSHRQERRA